MSAQEMLASTHLFRDGDTLVKEEMEFKSPGRRGKNVVWDFSQLEFKGSECRYEYAAQNDSLFEMLTSTAVLSYRYKQDTLQKTGYELPNLKMQYTIPQPVLRFPFCYGDSTASCFAGEGVYSHLLRMRTYGHTSIVADATGLLVLPDETCYRNAIRIHEHSVYGERMYSLSEKVADIKGDEDVRRCMEQDSVKWIVDTYQWYARGYRYPVFETVETLICCKGDSLRHFSNAYYTTKEILESLDADETNERIRDIDLGNYASQNIGQDNAKGSLSGRADKNGFFYNYFLTNGGQNVRVEFCQTASFPVEIILSDIRGIVYHHVRRDSSNGIDAVDFNISCLPASIYVLSIHVGDGHYTEKISLDR